MTAPDLKPSTLRHLSQGGVTAEQEDPSRDVYVAPAVGKDDGKNTLALPLKPIACFRIDDPRFHFDSSFLHPDTKEDFVAFAALMKGLPEAPISVFGHADPVGTDDYNKELSGRRAQAVYGVLTRNVDLWEHLYSDPHQGDKWKFDAVQLMLQSLGIDAPSDGKKDSPETKDAVKEFQTAHADELDVDGDAGPKTRKVIYRLYMDFLCDTGSGDPFKVDPTEFLFKGADTKLKGDVQGCGEFNPVLMFSADQNAEFQKPEAKTDRDNENAPNRRVTVFVFEKGTVVDKSSWPCPAATESGSGCKSSFWKDADKRRSFQEEKRTFGKNRNTFACRFYHGLSNKSPCERLVGAKRVRLKLVDHMNFPLVAAPVSVWVDDEAKMPGKTDSDGILTTFVPDGDYKIEMEDGRFAHFGDKYPFYQHDPVQELQTVEAFPFKEVPKSKNDQMLHDIEDLSDHLDVLYPDDKPSLPLARASRWHLPRSRPPSRR